MSERSVLVTGATGNQGGAVIDHLLAAETDFDIRGLTRDATSETAQALEDRGVTMVEGDLYDEASLQSPFGDVDAVFAVTNFWTEGYEGQVEQGENLADAAASADVDQFVFSGVGSHEQETGIPHFDSAWEIEQYAQDLGLPLTVLQPVFFFQNLEAFVEDILEGTIALPLAEGVPLQMVDVADVGRAATVAFERPDDFVGERVPLAGDELTLEETAEILSDVTGVDVDPVHVPIEDAYESFGEEFTVMCEWFNEVGYSADIGANEATFGFAFATLSEYLERHDWADKDGMASVPGWVKAL